MQPGEDREEGGGKEKERFDSRSFVHSGGREGEGRMIGKATEWPIAPRKGQSSWTA